MLMHHFCPWSQPHMSSAHLPGKLVLLAKPHSLEQESRESILRHLLCGTQITVVLPGPPQDLLSGFLLYPAAQWS